MPARRKTQAAMAKTIVRFVNHVEFHLQTRAMTTGTRTPTQAIMI
jgi:hypothetical protein